MSGNEDKRPPLRRDARRNRDMLLAAARTVYAEQGVDAPLDDIARRAGVGNATLYRHFAGRAALVEAVFSDALTAVLDAGEKARHTTDAWAGLTGYLEHIFELLASDRGAGDLMTTVVEGIPSLEALRPHNHETIDTLLRRAREQGAVRDDITTEDLLFLLAALGRAVPAAAAAAPGAWRRYLALSLDGLCARPGRPLPAPPLTLEEFGTAVRHLGCRPPRDG